MAKDNKKAKPVKEKKEKRNYFKNLKAELKKVIWPTPKQLFNNTLAVLAIVILVGVIVILLDLAFNAINDKAIDMLKSSIPAETVTEEGESTIDLQNVETVENLDEYINDVIVTNEGSQE